MAGRSIPLVTGEFYHVFNRGVAYQPVFIGKKDYEQALLGLSYYRFRKTPFKLSRLKSLSSDEREKVFTELNKSKDNQVEIISYVLMPNHFHLLLKQIHDKGVSRFISNFANSYTKYLNTKNKRVGPIFQGVFKTVRVETDEQLIHLSRYIHLNPIVSFITKEKSLFSYPWSSLSDYLKEKSSVCSIDPVLSFFSSKNNYKKFILDRVDYAKNLEEIKHLTLER